MIFIKNNDNIIKFVLNNDNNTYNSEHPDQQWLDNFGVYGTHNEFGEIAILPRTDISRLESKISSYKACNTQCEYCLEKFFVESYGYDDHDINRPGVEEIKKMIVKYKPSIIELGGGEVLQKKNKKILKNILDFLDSIDPHKKIRVEIISNGKDRNTIKKLFLNERVFITISLDPNEINLRFVPGETVLDTINDLARIDNKRIIVFWMISTHHNLAEAKKKFKRIENLGVKWIPQPLNEINGFFKNNEDFNLAFIKKLIDEVPSILDKYKPSNLLFPYISCLYGMVKIFKNNYVSCCTFSEPEREIVPYDNVINELSTLKIPAGTNHICSKLVQYDKNIPSNWEHVGRMTYTLIGYNLIKQANEKNIDIEILLEEYAKIYKSMIDFKHKMLKKNNKKVNINKKILVDVFYPHMSSIEEMSIVRLSERINYKIRKINDNTGILIKNQWWSYEDGVDIDGYILEDFISERNNIDNEKLIFITTRNNFPARILIIGKKQYIEEALLSDSDVYIYPKEYSNIRESIFSIKTSIDSSKL